MSKALPNLANAAVTLLLTASARSASAFLCFSSSISASVIFDRRCCVSVAWREAWLSSVSFAAASGYVLASCANFCLVSGESNSSAIRSAAPGMLLLASRKASPNPPMRVIMVAMSPGRVPKLPWARRIWAIMDPSSGATLSPNVALTSARVLLNCAASSGFIALSNISMLGSFAMALVVLIISSLFLPVACASSL